MPRDNPTLYRLGREKYDGPEMPKVKGKKPKMKPSQPEKPKKKMSVG